MKRVTGKGFTITVDDRRLQQMQKTFMRKARDIVDKTAFDAQGIAANAAPVDTGALRNSIYVSSRREDGYTEARKKARDANADVMTSPIPKPKEDLQANVGPSVEYGIYQEMGTKFMPPSAFLVPAAEAIWPNWSRAWKDFLRRL